MILCRLNQNKKRKMKKEGKRIGFCFYCFHFSTMTSVFIMCFVYSLKMRTLFSIVSFSFALNIDATLEVLQTRLLQVISLHWNWKEKLICSWWTIRLCLTTRCRRAKGIEKKTVACRASFMLKSAKIV